MTAAPLRVVPRVSLLAAALLAGCPAGEDNSENLSYSDLGEFTTDADGAVAVPWEVSEDAVSTLVGCGPYGYDTLATADDVKDPDGNPVFDDDAPFDGAMRVSTLDDFLPVLVPVSPDLDVSGGTWTLDMLVDAEALPTTVSCGAVTRVGDVSEDNTVNVEIVFVGVDEIDSGLTATAAEESETVQGVIASLGDLWSGLGVSVGTVTYEDFSGDTASFTTIEGDEEFGNLLRTATNDAAITFFFVQDIEFGDGASVLGLSGGPPGMATHSGTSKSGVVVNVADIASSPDEVSLIMAHEGGHFMGLFHTTEQDLSGSDPLGDTPECSNDSDGSGTLSSAECEGDGAENVMWPTAQTGTATTFSSDQAWVVARNPVTIPG